MNAESRETREASAGVGVWIVIAAYNEEAAIGRVVSDLGQTYPNVVVVDDGSADRTGNAALAAGATVLGHAINRGQGAALQTGISYAMRQDADVVVTFDADGQHRVEDLPQMLAPILDGRVDITLGSRFLGGRQSMPSSRRLLLKAAVLFTLLTSGIRLSDAHNGLRAFSRRAAERIDLTLDRMAHASEIIDQIRRSRLPFLEVPVEIRYTEYSMNKGQSAANAVGVALDYLTNRLLK